MDFSSYHFFFFNATASTEIYTLSLHDALPILDRDLCINCTAHLPSLVGVEGGEQQLRFFALYPLLQDRKSTRLNSSHVAISYAVFCLKKKNSIALFRNCQDDIV